MTTKTANNLRRFAIVGVLALLTFSGCYYSRLPYGAVMYGNVYENNSRLKEEFYESNLTYGSYSSAIEDYIEDDSIPSTRTKIIRSKDEYETVFKDFPVQIDFEKTIIVMHCFTTASGSFYKVKKISTCGNNLVIRYGTVKPLKAVANASAPLTKWIIVTMDKLDVETAEFIFEN